MIKKLRNNQCTEPPKCICTNLLVAPSRRSVNLSVQYKLEVHSCGLSNINISRNDKKVYVGSTQGPLMIKISKKVEKPNVFNRFSCNI